MLIYVEYIAQNSTSVLFKLRVLRRVTTFKLSRQHIQNVWTKRFGSLASRLHVSDFIHLGHSMPALSVSAIPYSPIHCISHVTSIQRHGVLSYWDSANRLISSSNGRTPGDEYGQFTFHNAKGCCSTIDYFVASAQCFSAVKSLHVLDEAARYRSDHNPLLLHIAYKAPCDTHTHTSSAASDARIRYDVQKAEAYQACLATELQQHFIPLIQQELNVDVLCDRLEACMKSAAQNTMPQACKRDGVHSRKHQPWFDGSCREAGSKQC